MLVAAAAQIVVAHLVHANLRSLFLIELIAAPLINVVVIVYAGCDATGSMPQTAARVERILERGWAIILLDAAISVVQGMAYASILLRDPGDVFLGMLAFFLSTMLIYSETFAALQPDVSLWLLVPFSIMRSMMLGWVNVGRICMLFCAVFIVQVGATAIAVMPTQFATDISLVYTSIAQAALWVFFTVAYVRTLEEERAAFPG